MTNSAALKFTLHALRQAQATDAMIDACFERFDAFRESGVDPRTAAIDAIELTRAEFGIAYGDLVPRHLLTAVEY